MAKKSQLTGICGVHYVAAYLIHKGVNATPTMRNVAGPDLLVNSTDGSASCVVQVKATEFAARNRGRGNNKKLDRYEWDIGWPSAHWADKVKFDKMAWFALVDLKEFQEQPDIFFVPPKVIADYFRSHLPDGKGEWKRARYHAEIATTKIERFKNNHDALINALEGAGDGKQPSQN